MTISLRKYINRAAFALGYMPKPQFPQAGPGSGYIFYRKVGLRHLRVLLATRSALVGVGSGISCGGWFELAAMLGSADGTTVTDQQSAAREGWEEIPGLFTVLPEALLEANSQPIYGAAIYKPNDRYGNIFHKANFLGMSITETEEAALCKLPKSNETSAPLRAVDIRWNVDNPAADDLIGLPDNFHHPHERDAFASLARLDDDGRLWIKRKAA